MCAEAVPPVGKFPAFVAFGEALTDLIRSQPNQWLSVPGGSPWNIARAMSAFGVSSAFAGAISQDCFGDTLWEQAVRGGLDLRFIQRLPKWPLLAVVHETCPPRYFFVGDDSADLYFSPGVLPCGWDRHVRWAHFGSISLAREPLASRLVSLAETLKRRGVRISYDPNFRGFMSEKYDAILWRMAAVADLIKVSEEDLRGLFRVDDEQVALARLRQFNRQAVILFTTGEQGASVYVGDECWHAHPPRIEVVDTVGAGDCSLAGMLSSVMCWPDNAWDAGSDFDLESGRDCSWERHLRQAVAAGTASCLSAGAEPPTTAQVNAMAASVAAGRC